MRVFVIAAALVLLGLLASSQAGSHRQEEGSLDGNRKDKLEAAWKAFASKWSKALAGRQEYLKKKYMEAMAKLKSIKEKVHAKVAELQSAEEANKEVDKVVAEHDAVHKRVIEEISDYVKYAGMVLAGTAGKITGKLANALKNLAQNAISLIGKRATLSEHLSNVGQALSGAVAPFKDIVAGVGETLKGHFSNLVDTVKGHVTALKGKLSGHVDDLKKHGSTLLEHGKNALGALSEVVSDILKQTLTNAKPAIDGLAKTAAGAGKTVLDHFSGADGASSAF